MDKSASATPITYSRRERLLINFSLATFLLVLAQLSWPLAEVSFLLGGTVFLSTLGWAIIKTPLPRVSILINVSRPKAPQFPQLKLPQIDLPKPSVRKPTLSWKIRAEVLELDDVRFSLLLLTASLLLGIFYTLSFVRFLNAHNGLTMFFVWEGLR